MNIEEQIKDILGYDEYEPSSLWVYLVETGKADIVKELSNLLTKSNMRALEGFENWLMDRGYIKPAGEEAVWSTDPLWYFYLSQQSLDKGDEDE